VRDHGILGRIRTGVMRLMTARQARIDQCHKQKREDNWLGEQRSLFVCRLTVRSCPADLRFDSIVKVKPRLDWLLCQSRTIHPRVDV